MCKKIEKAFLYMVLILGILTIGMQIGMKVQRDRSEVAIDSLNKQIETLVKTIHYNNGE